MSYEEVNRGLNRLEEVKLELSALEEEKRVLEKEIAEQILTCQCSKIPTKEPPKIMSSERKDYLKVFKTLEKDPLLLEVMSKLMK